MFKSKRGKQVALVLVLLLLLTSCAQIIDPSTGKIFPDKIIDLTSPWSFSDLGWFNALIVWPLAQALNFLSQYINVTIAVVLVTLFTRLLTLPLTEKSTSMTQKMQKIQPDINRIEEKYRGLTDQNSQMRKAQETQALYQKHDINPLGSMGGLFIQFPIMIGMWQAVQRAQSVLSGSLFGTPLETTPAQALSNLNFAFVAIFVVMLITQFGAVKLPQYLAKKTRKVYPNEKETKPQGQGMQYFMVAFIAYLAFNWPTAMSIYWLSGNIMQLAQTYYIHNKYNKN